jgi:hypothetical protein
MNTVETLLEIAKYTIPAIVVLIASYLVVKKFLVTETERKRLAIFQEGLDTTLRLRLQAYERLALFVERIHPRKLITRVYESGMTVRDLQIALTQNIKMEFEHNLSQQIYVSSQVWKTVNSVHEQEMAMINNIAAQLPPENSAKELHQQIITYLMSTEDEIPVEIALEMINEEAKLVLSQRI